MRKFWEDLKRTLKLYIIALIPGTILAMIAGVIWGQEIGDYVAMGSGAVGALWIIWYEHKHDVWGRRKCTDTQSKINQENLGPKDNLSSGS